MKRVTVLSLVLLLFSALAHAETLRVTFVDADGKPIPAASLKSFHCRSITDDEPIVADIQKSDGEAIVTLPEQPVQFSMMLEVPDFGYLMIYADNKGKGYSKAGTIDFATEAAATRIARVEPVLKHAEGGKVKVPKDIYEKLKAAKAEKDPYKSLALSLPAGEELTLARARHRISLFKSPRRDFYFGANTFQHPTRGALYDQRFQDLCNFGTTRCYETGSLANRTGLDYSRGDVEVNWLRSMGMSVMPAPAFYMLNTIMPQWLKDTKWPEPGKVAHDVMLQATQHYRGRAAVCEIANEVHDKANANSLGLTQKQLIEMVRILSNAAHEGDPDAKRLINSCNLWGEYAARPDENGTILRSPYRFLKECIDSKVDFELVGLQFYYNRYDFFEIERMLDKYAKLGKHIHVTEAGCQSESGVDPKSSRKAGTVSGWHGVWNEEKQADWVEGIYTILYSKSYVDAASWWDLADPAWYDYGGLIRPDCSPKPAYTRLIELQKQWGLKK